jgi:hypothetical protein
MPSIRAATAATAAPAKHHLNPDDLKAAAKLKPSIKEIMMRVRFGQALPPDQAPRRGRETGWTAPNGAKLIPVKLSSPPPAGSADFPSSYALVNPKTNEFYAMQSGGITGQTFAHGPLALPAATKFKTKNLTAADLTKLEAAANPAEKPTTKLPTKAKILGALGTYEFHKLVKYGNTKPPASSVLGEVKLKSDNHPDGYTYTALVLKNDPNKVVIQRSGGFAGITQYSQPLNIQTLPK